MRSVVIAYDQSTGQSLGLVVNLSQEGIMLVNSSPLKIDQRHGIQLDIAAGVLDSGIAAQIHMDVDCLWISPATELTNMYWGGCQIANISEFALAVLQLVIDRVTE